MKADQARLERLHGRRTFWLPKEKTMRMRTALFTTGILALLLLLTLGACSRGVNTVPPPTAIPTEVPATETLTPTVRPSATATALPPQNTATPTATFTATTPPWGTIQGSVWEDKCSATAGAPAFPCQTAADGTLVGDGKRQPGEPALAGVIVVLTKGSCPGALLSKTATDAQGHYAFSHLAPGTYCVLIDEQDLANRPLLIPGTWTSPGIGQGQMQVTLTPGSEMQVDFARTVQRAQHAQAVTPTLMPLTQPSATPTILPSITPTATTPPLPTPTLTNEQKVYALGEPQMHDPMDIPGANWLIFNSFPWAQIKPENGKLLVTILKPDPTHNLWIRSTYPALKDAYLEAVFQTGRACNHKDRYGLVVRSPSKYEGVVFVVSCDAMYKIYRWNGGLTVYRDWTHATMVHPGANQINRIGVWMEGNTLKLYINRKYVDEVEEDLFTEGDFALMVGGGATQGFQVAIDEVNYWTKLP